MYYVCDNHRSINDKFDVSCLVLRVPFLRRAYDSLASPISEILGCLSLSSPFSLPADSDFSHSSVQGESFGMIAKLPA